MKVYNPNIHFSIIHFWLFWRREQKVASTFLSTHGGGGRKKEEASFDASSQKIFGFSDVSAYLK